MQPTRAELEKTFPTGSYKLKKYQSQFDQMCALTELVEALQHHSNEKESMETFNSVVTKAKAHCGDRDYVTREDLVHALDSLTSEELTRFAPIEFFTNIGRDFCSGIGPFGEVLGGLNPIMLSAMMCRSTVHALIHYVINKDMMEGSPDVTYHPNYFVKWVINVPDRSVSIKGYHDDNGTQGDSEGGE